uniref:Peptidoglycan-associated protein n=1 Tax=Eiseniibacteriota bacterium TaxID=2212470 RepID=A0A832HZT4_UNCEI
MNTLTIRTLAVAALAATELLTGCARKSQEATPAPPTPPPTTTPAPTPSPSPTPAPTPAPPAPAPDAASQLRDVFFAFDSYALDDAARAALDATARVLRDNPDMNLTIEGHCDERGTVEYNQALGERRAGAARDYLVAAGIAPSRLHVISYGKERPFATGSDESAWAQNRRAHFVVR